MAKMLFIVDAEFNENIGIMCLSSYLKVNGHSVNLAIHSHYKNMEDLLTYINQIDPDLIGFSVMTVQADDYQIVTEVIKRRTQRKIIWGGPHCIYMPEVVMSTNDYVDIICIGEAEDSLLLLMNRIETNEDYSDIPGMLIRNNTRGWIKNEIGYLEQDLDKYPFPDRDLFYDISPILRHFNPKRIITQRGCPFKCSFCCEPLLKGIYEGKGKLIRSHSTNYIIREMQEVINRYPTRNIHFGDDTFNINNVQLKTLLEKYRDKIGLPFTCNIAANNVTEKLIIQLKDAGCTGVYFGFESGVEKIRFEILKKRVTNKQYLETARLLHKYDIDFVTSMMFCLPTETLNDAIETIRFNNRLRPTGSREFYLKMYKGTLLGDYALSRNLSVATGKYEYQTKDDADEHYYVRKIPINGLGLLFLKFPFLIRFAKPIIMSRLDKTLAWLKLPLLLLSYYSMKSFFRMSIWNIWNWRYFFASRKYFFRKRWNITSDFVSETKYR